MADLKAIVRGMYAGINDNADVAALAEQYLTEDVVEHEEMPGFEGLAGRERAEAQIGAILSAFSDLRFNIDDVVHEGDRVAARGTITGTHTGEMMGLPASGNKVDIPFMDVFRFRGDKISDHWGVTDTGALMMQIGAIEEPG